jgi:hypothetical protein
LRKVHTSDEALGFFTVIIPLLSQSSASLGRLLSLYRGGVRERKTSRTVSLGVAEDSICSRENERLLLMLHNVMLCVSCSRSLGCFFPLIFKWEEANERKKMF